MQNVSIPPQHNEWKRILGPSNYSYSTAERLILQPSTYSALQECVRIANTYKSPLSVTSAHKNWGYQSDQNTATTVVDLHKLNRIINIDDEMGTVTVQTGVTFRDLYTALAETNHMMSISGSSPDASIIGTVAERGIGKGIYGNYVQHIGEMKVLLPTGEIISTAYDNFPHSKLGHIAAMGIGPSLKDLFIQSNLGVILELTLFLLPRPSYPLIFYYTVSTAQLGNHIDALRKLKLEETIKGNFLIANDIREIAMKQQYPWNLTDKTPLPSSLRKKLQQQYHVSDWNGSGAVYSPTLEQARASQKRIKEILSSTVHTLTFLTPEINRKQSYTTSEQVLFNFNPLLGHIHEQSIRMMYWRKTKQCDIQCMDPYKDQCGLVWFSPAVPLHSKAITEVARILETSMLDHGFEPNLGITHLSDRLAYMPTAIIYDNSIEKEHQKALRCHDALQKAVSALGYYPYRLHADKMKLLQSADTAYIQTLRTIKKTLDPNNIFSPGRYDFTQ